MNSIERFWFYLNYDKPIPNSEVVMNKNNHFLVKIMFWPAYAFAYAVNSKESWNNKKKK